MSGSTEHGESAGTQAVSESAEPTGRRKIGHDEYDPVGTLTLILLYFLVLILMWVFTYFVEFLGNDPTPLVVT